MFPAAQAQIGIDTACAAVATIEEWIWITLQAFFGLAGGGATTAAQFVSVVAFLTQPGLYDTIPTESFLFACLRATVAIDPVPVIAFLASLDDAIAAITSAFGLVDLAHAFRVEDAREYRSFVSGRTVGECLRAILSEGIMRVVHETNLVVGVRVEFVVNNVQVARPPSAACSRAAPSGITTTATGVRIE
ncbi:hypothetical protein FGG08_006534 [Glutinoglossum americanum]|uniref:Uncharacterized protein n=1 Tax=Glutinoglossum americanum TaxID=1670608 RepID=A0A9P8I525_9PEZI|nr:hypothetical protein FGG08_006534 [Glutinoglossum americanum]